MKNLNIIYFPLLFIVLVGTYACKKNTENFRGDLDTKIASSNYLKLADFNAFKNLLSQIGKMSDFEYSAWKNENNLNTLYGRFSIVQQELLSSGHSYQIKERDSSFFLVRNSHLDSKNGILIDKVLNEDGLIQIGDELYRFVNKVLVPESNNLSKVDPGGIFIKTNENTAGDDEVKMIQHAEYVYYINPDIQTKSLRRSLVDSYVKETLLAKKNGGFEILKVRYTFYIQPKTENK